MSNKKEYDEQDLYGHRTMQVICMLVFIYLGIRAWFYPEESADFFKDVLTDEGDGRDGMGQLIIVVFGIENMKWFFLISVILLIFFLRETILKIRAYKKKKKAFEAGEVDNMIDDYKHLSLWVWLYRWLRKK